MLFTYYLGEFLILAASPGFLSIRSSRLRGYGDLFPEFRPVSAPKPIGYLIVELPSLNGPSRAIFELCIEGKLVFKAPIEFMRDPFIMLDVPTVLSYLWTRGSSLFLP